MINKDPFGLQELRDSIKDRPQRIYGRAQTVSQQMAGEEESQGFLKSIVSPAIETGKNIAEISVLFPEVKYARGKIQELRDTGDMKSIALANDLEKQIGKKPTMAKVIGDVAGTALLAVPIPALKFLKVAPTLRTFIAGGLFSSGFGAAEALSQDKNASQVLSQAVVSGLLGAPLIAGGGLIMKYGGGLIGKAIGAKIPEALKPIYIQLANMGKAGKILSDNFRKVQISAKHKAGTIMEKLSNVGLFRMPRLTPFQKKPVPLLSEEAAWLGENSLFDVLEGRATLKNATPEVKAAYKLANQIRNELGQSLKEVVEKFTLRKNFFRRITPDPKIVQLSSTEKLALKNAKTADERIAIHLQSSQKNSLRRRVLLNAVEKRKSFSSIEKAAETLDGWTDWVVGGGRIVKRGGVSKMVNYLVASGQAKSKGEALSKMRKMFIEGKSSLLKGRELDFPFYDPDPRIVLPAYIMDATLKIEQNKFLSKKVQQKLLSQIQQDGGFDARARTTALIDEVIGAVSRAPAGEKIPTFLRALQIPKLSFAQILNFGQNVNTYLATDLGSFGYGLSSAFSDKGVRSALKSGATLQTLIRQQTSYIGGGSEFAEKFLKYSGFTWTEMFNRTVASNAGQKYAQQVANRLVSNPTNRYLQWQLKELGIPDERISQIAKGISAEKGIAQEARKFVKEGKSVEEFVEKMYIEPSYTLEPGLTRLTKQKTTGLYHGTSPEGIQGILNTGKIEARVTELDKIGQKSVSITGSKGVAGSYGNIIFELDPKLRVIEPPAGAVKGDYYKGFEFRHTEDIPISKIKSAFIDIGKKESLDTKMIVGWEKNKPIYKTIGEVKNQLEAKGIKTYVANFADKSQLADIYTQATKPEIMMKEILTPEETLQAGAIMARETQFFSDPLNLPAFASSPWGKVFVQYKNFSYNQLRFVHRQIRYKPGFAQKLRTLLVLSTIFPMVGEVTSDIRSLITGSKRPTKAFDRYLQNIANAGTFGLALDLWESATFGASTEFLVGPTTTSAGNLIDSHVRSITKGEPDPVLKWWLQQTGVGRIISNRVWQSKVKNRGGVFEFWEDL